MSIKVFDQVAKTLSRESLEIKQDIQEILERLEYEIPVTFPHVRPLFDIARGLFEIRVKDRAGQFRVIYFVKKQSEIYLLHAFRKKTQVLAKKEIDLVLRRLREVQNGKN